MPLPPLISKFSDVDLWSPRDPALYDLKVTLLVNSRPVDALQTRIGFRTIHFDPAQGFFLNGRSLRLRGLNRRRPATDNTRVGAISVTAETMRRREDPACR